MQTKAKDRERGARKLSRSMAKSQTAEVARKVVSALLAGQVPTSILQQKIVGDALPYNTRTHYGRGLTLDRIESVIRSANEGRMRGITELSRETMELSGHMSATVGKRMNRVASGRIVVSPASGEDIDEARAQEYADEVRGNLKQIPEMGGALVDLAWSAFDGRSCQELEWNLTGTRKTKWMVTGLHWVFPMRLSFDSHRNIRIVDERVEGRGFSDEGFPVEETPMKFITCKPRLFGDLPEREGVARRCLYPAFFSRFGVRERLILMELFGKPQRTAHGSDKPNAPEYDDEVLDAVQDILDRGMGGASSTVLPFGFFLDTVFPPAGAGTVHGDVIKHAEDYISKVCLGHTNAVDAQAQGIGGQQAQKAADAEDLIIASDWGRIGGYLTHQFALPIVVVNHGVDAAPYAPLLTIEALEVPDPKKEGEKGKDALALGLKLATEELYQRTGWRKPGEDESYIHNVQGPAGAGGVPGVPVATIVYPKGEAPDAGELEQQPTIATIEGEDNVDASELSLTPSDLASVVTVNEARESVGLGPLLLPTGGEDPDGKLSVAEYKAKREAAGAALGTAEGTPEPKPGETPPPAPNDGAPPPTHGNPGAPPFPKKGQPPQAPPKKPGNQPPPAT